MSGSYNPLRASPVMQRAASPACSAIHRALPGGLDETLVRLAQRVVVLTQVQIEILDGPVGVADTVVPTVRVRRPRPRSVLLQALAGLAALAGVAAGAAVTVHQVRVNREGHTIGLFTTAVEQLSSPQVAVRHGGVYALAFLAELDPRYAGKIHALLTAFIRQRAPWPPTRPAADVDDDRSRFHAGLADDVGGAVSALRAGAMIAEAAVSELENVDLRDAQLDDFAIGRVCLVGSNLSNASLVNADLSGATMTNTILRGTNLAGATLSGADLSAADLQDATLTAVVHDADTRWPPGFSPPR